MQPRRLSQACRPLRSRIFFWLIGPILLVGCTSSQQKAADLAVQAQQLIAAGDYAAAGRDLRAAVQIRDDDSAIWLLLGQVEQRNGNLREAFIAYNRANELKPSDPDTLRSIAYTGYLVGARSDSASAADRLLVLSPSDSAALSVKGLMALDERDTKTALGYADNILTTNPGDETGILLKARALAVGGDIKGAIALLNETQSRAGPSGGLLTLRLQLERVAGNAAAMREIYPQLLKMNPKGEDLYVDYANFLFKTGDADQARKILTDGMLMQRRNGPYLGWAFSVLDRYEPTNVPPRLDPRIAKQPPSLLRSAAARYLLDRGDARGAAALVSPQGAVDPNDRGIYAAALDAMGRRAEAEAIVDELLAKPDAQDPEALILRARWMMAANPGRAATAAQAAVLADTTNIRARLLLADIYATQGDAIRVRQVYRQAANDLPGNRRVLDALLAFLQRSGDKDGMVGAIRTFADANGSDSGAWGMLADLCKQQGNTSCADTARFRQKNAINNYSSPNPNRPNLERGLFSALNRPT
jgi:Tfp pilus assembly protein PilF